jgi:hypothetical protein
MWMFDSGTAEPQITSADVISRHDEVEGLSFRGWMTEDDIR